VARSRSRVPLRTLVDGFDNARLRFETVAGGADVDAKFVALFEVVAWGGAIWDWFDKRSKGKTVPPEALACGSSATASCTTVQRLSFRRRFSGRNPSSCGQPAGH
jgi:hypothetical protein